MKKFWQIVIGIGSILSLILAIIFAVLQGTSIDQAREKQQKIKQKAKEKKEVAKKEADKEKSKLAAMNDQQIIDKYYQEHPSISKKSTIDKQVKKALKNAAKYRKKGY